MNLKSLCDVNEPFFHIVNEKYEKFMDIMREEFINDEELIIKTIEGSKCNITNKLFKEFSERLMFPSYFSYNWNSFDECINDLEWLDGNGYIIVIKDAGRILVDEQFELDSFFTFFESVANEWSSGRNYDDFPTPPTSFHLVLECDFNSEVQIINMLSKLGIKFNKLI